MRAGSLDRRITFQKNTPAQSSSGFPVESWADQFTVWAGLTWQRNRSAERFRDPQIAGESAVVFRVRWSADTRAITSEWRVRYDGRTYDIIDLRELGRREGLEIEATVRSENKIDNR